MNNLNNKGRRFAVPEAVEGRAKAAGDIGLAWLENIDLLVDDMEEKWNIHVTKVLSGGSHALVALADGSNGDEYVLKLDVPDNSPEEYMREITALKIADGTYRAYSQTGEFLMLAKIEGGVMSTVKSFFEV